MLAIHVSASFFLAQKVAALMRRNRHAHHFYDVDHCAEGRATVTLCRAKSTGRARPVARRRARRGRHHLQLHRPRLFRDRPHQAAAGKRGLRRLVNSRVALRRWGKP
jgi:hypothetical protein